MKNSVFSVMVVAMTACGSNVVAENWPRFRGINGAGVSSSKSVPSTWDETNYRWVAELGGTGHSSPVIWGNSVFVTAADEQSGKRALICLDKRSGKENWRKAVPFTNYKKHKNNSFASSTPAADEDHVYQLWHSKESTSLIAYRHQGDEVWQIELGPYLHGQGGATSPIVAGDLVVVAHDHKSESFLIAVDRKTGQTKWKLPREGKRACYSTPCVRKTETGSEIVFVHCYEGVIGVDQDSGDRIWHIDPFGRASQRALASPVVTGNLVIAGSGAVGGERQIVAIDIQQASEKTTAVESYRLIRQSPHVPSPLVVRDRLYLWNDGGVVTCCDANTGDKIWQKRVGGTYFSSPIAIGDRIYSIDTTGEVVVIADSDEDLKVIAKNPMGESSRASLAVSENTLFVRTESKLFAISN